MTESLVGFAVLLFVVFMGFPLGFAMVVVGFVGFGLVRGWEPALETVGQLILDFAMSYSFSVLPLFVLMGAFVYRAALSEDLYDASNAWLGHHKGGLAMATVAACGGFSAVSGSSVATAATMAKVAMPSMRRYRYNENLAAGTIAAGGTMGILIPPSIALVIYGIIVEEDVGKLFIAGIVPGIITVLLYIFVIKILITFRPELGPRGPWTPWKDRFIALTQGRVGDDRPVRAGARRHLSGCFHAHRSGRDRRRRKRVAFAVSRRPHGLAGVFRRPRRGRPDDGDGVQRRLRRDHPVELHEHFGHAQPDRRLG